MILLSASAIMWRRGRDDPGEKIEPRMSVDVACPGGQRFHRENVIRDTAVTRQSGMIEYPEAGRMILSGHVACSLRHQRDTLVRPVCERAIRDRTSRRVSRPWSASQCPLRRIIARSSRSSRADRAVSVAAFLRGQRSVVVDDDRQQALTSYGTSHA